jgi:hypothetical protein
MALALVAAVARNPLKAEGGVVSIGLPPDEKPGSAILVREMINSSYQM